MCHLFETVSDHFYLCLFPSPVTEFAKVKIMSETFETQCEVYVDDLPTSVKIEEVEDAKVVSPRVQKGRDLLLTDPRDGTIVSMEDKALRHHLSLMTRLVARQNKRGAPKPAGYRVKTERSALRKFENAWMDLTYLQAKDLLSIEGEMALRWIVEHTEVTTEHDDC